MNRTLAVGGVLMVAALAAAGLTSAGAAAEESATPTFREFEAATYVDSDGQYIVNGDEPIATRAQLRTYYDAMTGGRVTKKTPDNGLVVNTVGGRDDAWSASQVGNLTYCVSTRFGTDRAAIASAMQAGAGLWEAQSSAIDFVYVSSQDGNCTTRNTSVVFSVEPVQTSQYIARAFFPSSSKRVRNVLIDDSIWSSGNWEPADILAHELGHALGFRHEHTRPEAGTCFEDNSWRPLTPYDGSSIMHYPQCNGASADLEFSSYDGQGVRALYGP